MVVEDSLIEALMNRYFNGTAYAPPATLYLAVLNSGPTSSNGTGAVEPTTNGAARVAKTANTANFPLAVAGSRTITNGTVITFPTATGAGWGSIEGVGVFEVSPAGTGVCKWYAELTGGPQTINAGNTPTFAVGELDFVAVP